MYNELGILQRINTAALSASHPGRKHIPALLDHFKISSEHGDHLCLVFETLGLSIAKIDGKVAIPAVKSFTRQLLTAFIFLHEECEVVHTGKHLAGAYSVVTSRKRAYNFGQTSNLRMCYFLCHITLRILKVESRIIIRRARTSILNSYLTRRSESLTLDWVSLCVILLTRF